MRMELRYKGTFDHIAWRKEWNNAIKDLKREFCRIKDNQVLCQLIVKIKIEGKADRTAKVFKFIYPISRLDKTSLHQGLGKLSENRINSYSI